MRKAQRILYSFVWLAALTGCRTQLVAPVSPSADSASASAPSGLTLPTAPAAPAATYLHMVYAAISDASGAVAAYKLNAQTGALSLVSQVAAGQWTEALVIDPSAKYVYAGNLGDNTVNAYRISSSDGSLGSIGNLLETTARPNAQQVKTMITDPAGKYLFTGHRVDPKGEVTAYSLNSVNGAITQSNALDTGGKTRGICITPDGKFLYSTIWTQSKIRIMTVATNGSLSDLGTVDTGPGPVACRVDAAGKNLYTADDWSNSVSHHTIDPATGALSAVDTTAGVGNNTTNIALSTDGKYLYSVSWAGDLTEYSVNATTGVLTQIGSKSLTTFTSNVVVDADGNFVITGGYDGKIQVYRIDRTTGHLTALSSVTNALAVSFIAAAKVLQ